MQLSCSDQDMDTLKAKQSANLKLANCHSKKSMYQDHGEPTSSTVETAAKDKLESNNQSLMHVGTGSKNHVQTLQRNLMKVFAMAQASFLLLPMYGIRSLAPHVYHSTGTKSWS